MENDEPQPQKRPILEKIAIQYNQQTVTELKRRFGKSIDDYSDSRIYTELQRVLGREQLRPYGCVGLDKIRCNS